MSTQAVTHSESHAGGGLRDFVHAHRFAIYLGLIAVAGLVLRVVYDVALRSDSVGGDGFRYYYGAQFLADGQGFLNPLGVFARGVRVPDTGHPPAWTVLLAGPVKLGLRTRLENQLVTSVVGVGTIVMTGLAGRAAFGKRTGLFAAALAAVYPFFWLYEREVLSEPLAMLLIATMIWLAYRFLAAPGWGLAIALGAVVGLLAMTKSDQLAIAVLLVVPLILARRNIDLRKRIVRLVAAGAVCVVIMAPWSIYLSDRFDRPVVLTGSLGGSMAAGNCKETYEGKLLAYYDIRCGLRVRATGDPISRDAQARQHVLDFMADHKGRVPVVVAARIGRTFGVFRPFQQMELETERGTPEWVFNVGFVAYWLLVPIVVVGAVIARRRRIPIYPLIVFPVVVVLAVLLTIGAVRYRAPAEVPLVILAAFAIDARLRRKARGAVVPDVGSVAVEPDP